MGLTGQGWRKEPMQRFRIRNLPFKKTCESYAIQSACFCWPFHTNVESLHSHAALHWFFQLLLPSHTGRQSHNAPRVSCHCAPARASATAWVANNCEIESNCANTFDETFWRLHMTWGHKDMQMFCSSVCQVVDVQRLSTHIHHPAENLNPF